MSRSRTTAIGGILAAAAAVLVVFAPGIAGARPLVTPPSVTVVSTTSAATHGVTVQGSGWTPGHQIRVNIGSLATFGIPGTTVCQLTVTSDGTIAGNQSNGNCSVPKVPAGSQPLTATDVTAAGSTATGTAFAVKPALFMTPAHSTAGTPFAVGATVTIQGSGYAAGSTISSFKLGTTTLTTSPSSVTIGSGGNFLTPVTFTVPAVMAGNYTLTATDSSSNLGSSPLTAVYAPHVTVSPGTGSGRSALVTGSGWPKGDEIFVQIGSSTFDATGFVVCALTASPAGTIAGSQSSNNCTVPHTGKGTQPLVAIDDQNQGVVATSTYAVGPALELTPAHTTFGQPSAFEASPGVTVSVQGRGFAAGSTVSSFKLGSTTLTTSPSSVSIGSLGNFSSPVTFTVPASTAPGTYTVTATDSSSNTGSSPLTIYVPHVTISGNTGAAGQGVTITGSGWPKGDSIFVQVGSSVFDQTGSLACVLTANVDGTIVGNQSTGNCTMPLLGNSAGQSLVAIDDQNQGVVANSTTAVTPGLVLTPPHNLAVGSPVVPGQTISVLGHGFTPGSTVSSFKFNGSTVTTSPSTVNIGSLGNFSGPVTFTVPAIQAGTYNLTATDASSKTGTSPLTMYVPHITVSPTSRSAGGGLTVTGSGWPKGDFIFVQIGPQATIFDDDVVCALTASTDGTIVGNQAMGNCSVPSVASGSQPLVAIDDENQDVIANGAAFTVSP